MPASPDGPTAAGSPTTTLPAFQSWFGPNGWYLLHFLDGSIALVYLKNHIWQWTKQTGQPNTPSTFAPYFLGDSQQAASQGLVNRILKQIGATGKQGANIISAIDNGRGWSD